VPLLQPVSDIFFPLNEQMKRNFPARPDLTDKLEHTLSHIFLLNQHKMTLMN
jgi:hypothetical protein